MHKFCEFQISTFAYFLHKKRIHTFTGFSVFPHNESVVHILTNWHYNHHYHHHDLSIPNWCSIFVSDFSAAEIHNDSLRSFYFEAFSKKDHKFTCHLNWNEQHSKICKFLFQCGFSSVRVHVFLYEQIPLDLKRSGSSNSFKLFYIYLLHRRRGSGSRYGSVVVDKRQATNSSSINRERLQARDRPTTRGKPAANLSANAWAL